MKTLAILAATGAALALAALAGPADAASRLTADMGRGIAERICAGCHEVEPNQAIRPEHPGAPKFVDIANRPGTSAASLRKHLKTTHASKIIPMGMPNPELTDDETTKVVDYILSLKTTP
jgi:mono/diheme cytochrome c family protein